MAALTGPLAMALLYVEEAAEEIAIQELPGMITRMQTLEQNTKVIGVGTFIKKEGEIGIIDIMQIALAYCQSKVGTSEKSS